MTKNTIWVTGAEGRLGSALVQLLSHTAVSLLGFYQLRNIGGYTYNTFYLTMSIIPRELGKPAPRALSVFPTLAVDSIGNRHFRTHDFQFLMPCHLGGIISKEMRVFTADKVRRRSNPHFSSSGLIGHHKA